MCGMRCEGGSCVEGLSGEGGWLCSLSPRAHVPPGGNRGGTPTLTSDETSRLTQQRGDAAGGGDGSTLHRGGSDGVSCSNGDRQQVSIPAGGLSDTIGQVSWVM